MMTNLVELSVSDLSGQLKKTIEEQFSYVKIRGEISGFKRHSSGHLYFSLKDDKAVINAIMWKGTTSRLNFAPEDGLEVLATGKVTTFSGRSQYQIVVDNMEPAGVGALMALLEKRKAQFTQEGFFAQERKKKLPYLPKVIAILTSETGAVIRDIIHRLRDRYMPHILLLPIAVQGEMSAKQVAYGVKLFNKCDGTSALPRPDVIIIARGGGSIEDLWSFNEEIVVRAIAASDIPVISAVGHETDFTLCDFVADLRAPTPTAAAEMAVPVKRDLEAHLHMLEARLRQALTKHLSLLKERTHNLMLPDPERILGPIYQRLDYATQRLPMALRHIMALNKSHYDKISSLLRPEPLKQNLRQKQQNIIHLGEKQDQYMRYFLRERTEKMANWAQMLEILSYKSVLKRGYTVIKDQAGNYLSSHKEAQTHQALEIEFHDGTLNIQAGNI